MDFINRNNRRIASVLFSMVVSFFVLAIIVFNVSEIAFALTPQSLQSEPLIPGPLELGMVGITSTQTARLNIVQIPVDPDSPSTSPCAVVLNFYDSSGNLLKSKSVANLSDGHAAFIDLNGNALMLSNPTAFTNGSAEMIGRHLVALFLHFAPENVYFFSK